MFVVVVEADSVAAGDKEAMAGLIDLASLSATIKLNTRQTVLIAAEKHFIFEQLKDWKTASKEGKRFRSLLGPHYLPSLIFLRSGIDPQFIRIAGYFTESLGTRRRVIFYHTVGHGFIIHSDW